MHRNRSCRRKTCHGISNEQRPSIETYPFLTKNLKAINLADSERILLARKANRSMKLQVNVQEGDLMVSVDDSIMYSKLITLNYNDG